MVLNNKPQAFVLYFPSNFFYPEVCEMWSPIVERMKLPYQSVCDFMNAQIQSISFPGINAETATQQREQYTIVYPTGKEVAPLVSKDLTITFKLTESYISYFIMKDQFELYLKYATDDLNVQNRGAVKKKCWMEPIHMKFLSDVGYSLIDYVFEEITLTSLSNVELSYAATVAQYNTFQLGFTYNKYNVL